MPPPARPLRADARRNREKVVTAARELLGELGFEAQMDDVAARAQLGVGTIYRHFPTKDALFGELVKEQYEAFAREVRVARAEIADGREPFEALADTLRRNGEISAADRGVQDAMLFATAGMMRVAERALQALSAETTAIIELAKAAGTIRADARVDDIRLVMCGVSATQSPRSPHFHPDEWRRHLQLVVDGLRAHPEPKEPR